jgi:hypothetical protein
MLFLLFIPENHQGAFQMLHVSASEQLDLFGLRHYLFLRVLHISVDMHFMEDWHKSITDSLDRTILMLFMGII